MQLVPKLLVEDYFVTVYDLGLYGCHLKSRPNLKVIKGLQTLTKERLRHHPLLKEHPDYFTIKNQWTKLDNLTMHVSLGMYLGTTFANLSALTFVVGGTPDVILTTRLDAMNRRAYRRACGIAGTLYQCIKTRTL